jgi:hypothetical protein
MLSVALPTAANRPAMSSYFSVIALFSLVESTARLPSFWKEMPTWLRVVRPPPRPCTALPSAARSWLWTPRAVESPCSAPAALVSAL